MARKDLTALAALGTLGYMLSKKGDKKDEKSTSDAAERRIAADKVASAEPQTSFDTQDMIVEPGSGPHDQQFRDELPYASAPTVDKKPTAPKPAARKPVVKSRPMSPAMDTSMQESNVSPTTRAEYDRGISNVPRRNSYYKKGGPVKKMASGGMTSSASKRADGIATKGKTRGKIC
jgi:hypothetical protein